MVKKKSPRKSQQEQQQHRFAKWETISASDGMLLRESLLRRHSERKSLKKWKSEMKKSIGSLKLHLKNDSIKEAGYCCSHLLHRLLTKAHEMTSDKVEVILIRQPESHKRGVVQRKQSYVYEESRSAEVLILIPAARILSMSPHHRASVRDLWTGVSCKCRCTSSAAPLLTH